MVDVTPEVVIQTIPYKDNVYAQHPKREQLLENSGNIEALRQEDVAHALSALGFFYKDENVSAAAQEFHDGWAYQKYQAGWEYGSVRDNDAKRHPLLRPYKEMENTQMEDSLAVGDINGVGKALLRRYYGIETEGQSFPVCLAEANIKVFSEDDIRNLQEEKIRSIQLSLASLAKDDGFLRDAAPDIHNTWREITIADGKTPEQDNRIERTFSELSVDDQQTTLGNIKEDILGIALAVETTNKSLKEEVDSTTGTGKKAEWMKGLDSLRSHKAQFVIDRLPEGANVYVDVGCFTGAVVNEIKQEMPGIRAEGVDFDSKYIVEAQQAYPELTFHRADPVQGLPYSDGEVNAFSCLSVLHEFYVYNGYSEEAAVSALSEMRRCLSEGGRIIVRDPVMPESPEEILKVTLDKENGENPSDDELLQVDPDKLSQHALMRRFLKEFTPIQASDTPPAITQEENTFAMPKWLIGEFIRKRTFTQPPSHWTLEMKEQNAPFTVGKVRELAEKAGFSNVEVESVYDAGFYAEIKEGDGVRITDLQGNAVDQASVFPSHLYAVLQK